MPWIDLKILHQLLGTLQQNRRAFLGNQCRVSAKLNRIAEALLGMEQDSLSPHLGEILHHWLLEMLARSCSAFSAASDFRNRASRFHNPPAIVAAAQYSTAD